MDTAVSCRIEKAESRRDQISSSATPSNSIAAMQAKKNDAVSVERASLLAMLAMVHLKPCFFSRPTDVDRRFARNQNGRRKVVVIIRERGGNSVSAVCAFGKPSFCLRARIAKETVVHADEAGSWDNLHERFEVKRINHQEAYSLDGACTNWAEEYISRLRRAEIGVHHHIAGAYLLRYAQESSW